MTSELKSRIQRIRQATEAILQQNQSLNLQLQQLQSQIQQLQQDKSTLLQNQLTFQEKWNALLNQNKQQQTYIQQLTNERDSLQNQIQQLSNQISNSSQNTIENTQLQDRIITLENTINLQKNSLAELKEENKLIKLAKNLSANDSDNHDLKIKINELVKDIDRCIDLLNE